MNKAMQVILAAGTVAAAMAAGAGQAQESISAVGEDGVPLWQKIYPMVGSLMPPTKETPAMPPVVGLRRVAGATAFTDLEGRTLYTRDGDTDPARSACTADCAKDWRPLPAAWTARGMADWSVMTRADGSRQWAYQGKAVYTHAGDAKPGDSTGDGKEAGPGSGGGAKWHTLVATRDFRPDNTKIAAIPFTNIGPSFTTEDGKTLYFVVQFIFEPRGNTRYNSPTTGTKGCVAQCLEQWQPFVAPKDAKPSGEWGIAQRDDGTPQWTFRGHALYTYAGDGKPGDARGEGIADIQNGITGRFWSVAALNP